MITEMDDALLSGMAATSDTSPSTPENNLEMYSAPDEPQEIQVEPDGISEPAIEDQEEESKLSSSAATDDYGNEKTSKTYTEEEVNERINRAVRERLARMEKNQVTPRVEPQQNAYSVNEENDDWKGQLESFVEQTLHKVTEKNQQRVQQEQERYLQQEFEAKIQGGMGRFADFIDVVGSQPITDAMTLATRGLQDPAAFLYAASKREPQEIKRISEIRDPYRQMVEMGKLEERLKQQKPSTKAPRPMSTVREDSGIPVNQRKIESLDEMLAANDRSRISRIQQQRRR